MNKHSDYDMLYQLIVLIYVAINPPSCLLLSRLSSSSQAESQNPRWSMILKSTNTHLQCTYLLYIALTIYSMHIKLYFSFIYYLQIFKYSFVFADSVSAVALSSLFISYIDTYITSNRKNDLKFRFNSQISLYKFKI